VFNFNGDKRSIKNPEITSRAEKAMKVIDKGQYLYMKI